MLGVFKERIVRVALEARYVERGPVVLVERSLELETLQELRVGGPSDQLLCHCALS